MRWKALARLNSALFEASGASPHRLSGGISREEPSRASLACGNPCPSPERAMGGASVEDPPPCAPREGKIGADGPVPAPSEPERAQALGSEAQHNLAGFAGHHRHAGCSWRRRRQAFVGYQELRREPSLRSEAQHDLPRFTGHHRVEAFLEVVEIVTMGDDGGDVEAAPDHGFHLVPGFEDFAAVDAFDEEAFEDDFVPVDAGAVGEEAEEGDAAAVVHVVEHLAESLGAAGHFEADVEAADHAEALHAVFEALFGDVDGVLDAEFAREAEAPVVDVGEDDVARAVVAGDGGGHDADGASSGDEDVLSDDVVGEGGVGGVAVGVEDGGDVVGHGGVDFPDVGGGDGDVFGEAAVAVDADAFGVGAEVAFAGLAGAAFAADDVAFGGDALADFPAFDVFADFDDFADEFVADGHGGFDGTLGPVVPKVDVDVGAADGGLFDFDEYIRQPDFGHGDVGHPDAFFGGFLDEGFHTCSL